MGFYIGIYLLFIFVGIITAYGLFAPSYFQWVIFPRNCSKIFNNQIDFSKINFVIKERKLIYLSFYGFSLVLYLVFTFVLPYLFWLMLNSPEYHHWKFAIPLIITYFLFQLLFVFTWWKLWKKISGKIVSKKEAIDNFVAFKKNWTETKTLKTVDFKLEILSRSWNRYNQIFQYHQENLVKKIIKLHEKKWPHDVFNYKLLQIFISYLERNAWQFKTLKAQFVKYKIWINDDFAEIDQLKTAIINNFFSFEAGNITFY